MKVRIFKAWDDLRSSYWFVPLVMVLFSIALSFLTVYLDDFFQSEVLRNLGFLWSGGSESARGLLETVAGSMITVAGVTFSITMVALSLASSQFGSRLLRNFMADTSNQIVLGTFVSTFVYCLLVLRTVRTSEDAEFVPYISVTLAMLFALTSLGVLIYFIHHIALSMQAPYVIGQVANDLFATVERLFPSHLGFEVEDGHQVPDEVHQAGLPVEAKINGYLQAVDVDSLLEIAVGEDLILRLDYRPGHFVVAGYPLVYVWPGERLDDKVKKELIKAFIIGKQRTHTQDVEFAFEQLVEVAVRSLSAGINDPFNAISCIDWLGAGLAALAQKEFPSPFRFDQHGKLRIYLTHPLTFRGVLDASFNQIRQYAKSSVSVQIRLLEVIAMIAEFDLDEQDRAALEHHAAMIQRASQSELSEREDLKDVRERYKKVRE